MTKKSCNRLESEQEACPNFNDSRKTSPLSVSLCQTGQDSALKQTEACIKAKIRQHSPLRHHRTQIRVDLLCLKVSCCKRIVQFYLIFCAFTLPCYCHGYCLSSNIGHLSASTYYVLGAETMAVKHLILSFAKVENQF